MFLKINIFATETTALSVMGNAQLSEQIQTAYLEKFSEATLRFFSNNSEPTT